MQETMTLTAREKRKPRIGLVLGWVFRLGKCNGSVWAWGKYNGSVRWDKCNGLVQFILYKGSILFKIVI